MKARFPDWPALRNALDRRMARRRDESTSREVQAATEAFRSRRYDDICAGLRERYGLPVSIAVEEDASDGEPHAVAWHLSSSHCHFLFDAALLGHPSFDVLIFRWVKTLPLLLGLRRRAPDAEGSAILNLGDCGSMPGIAFCEYRPSFTLIPDPHFMASRGYALHKAVYDRQNIPWPARLPRAVWRGRTSGWYDVLGREIATWRDLPRVRLCEIAQCSEARARIDACLSGLGQIPDDGSIEAIGSSGLVGAPMPWQAVQRYKYQIDIDGNSNAWEGLFIKLCSGGCVLKVQSSLGFRQWYYDRLVPWINVVPVAADMSDLLDKIEWLERHDEVAREIGRNGARLAASMTYEAEVLLAARRLESALRGMTHVDPA